MKSRQLTSPDGKQINGPLVITPDVTKDERGYFFESWNQRTFNDELEHYDQTPVIFVQDNQSCSAYNVLRGLHWQRNPHAQGKLVRCTYGRIFDVAVDLRQNSPTFMDWVGVELSSDEHNQIWIPPGFAHGFLTMSDTAVVLYKTTEFWHKGTERSVRWDDSAFAIEWPGVTIDNAPTLSPKDNNAPRFNQLTYLDLFQ